MLMGSLLILSTTRGGDLSGTAQLSRVQSDQDPGQVDTLSQNYQLRWFQQVTPAIGFFASYQSYIMKTEDDTIDFERRSREPTIELTYSRPGISARVGWQDRRTRGSSDAETLDSRSVTGQVTWRPSRGPQYTLRWADSTNVADVEVFGRDQDTRSLAFDTGYLGRGWSARYSFEDFTVDNNLTGFRLDQQRNTLRATWSQDFLDEKLSLQTDWLYGRTDIDEQVPAGETIAEIVRVREGLFAIDTTPLIGVLDPAPGLVDGDRLNPVLPRIEIGGASTFRNIGVDLGVTRPVTRLEITVDSLSDPDLIWTVYQSDDNLTWQTTGLVSSDFDVDFLRYRIRFPETTNRYFKAVNVSANSESTVAVTEIRALRDVEGLTTESRRATNTRAYVVADLVPGGPVNARFSFGLDDDTGSGQALADFHTRDLTYDLQLDTRFTGTLRGLFQYHLADSEREREPLLSREETRYAATLLYEPLEQLNATLNASRREESQAGSLLRRDDQLRAGFLADLLPGLHLGSEVVYDDVSNPFTGVDYTSWTWNETLDTRPVEPLGLRGGVSVQRFMSGGLLGLERRNVSWGQMDWRIGRFVNLLADWSYGREDRSRTTSQRYAMSWTPGTTLSVSGSWFASRSSGGVETSTAGIGAGYRMNRNLRLFSNWSRSKLTQRGVLPSRVTSLQYGLALTF